MVRLTKLKIDRFRNVKPGTVLEFGPTFNVLLGKNATGKTTLLDLIAAVTNDDLSAYASEEAGFDLTWWLEEGGDQVERRAVRTAVLPGTGPVHVHYEFDDAWTIALRTAEGDTRTLKVTGVQAIWEANGESVGPFDVRTSIVLPGAGARAVEAVPTPYDACVERLVDMVASEESVGRFDEALAAIDAVAGSRFEFVRVGNRVSHGSGAEWLPKDLVDIVRLSKSSDPLVVSFDSLESLRAIPAALGFVSAQVRPRMLKQSQDVKRVTTTYQGFDFLFSREDGSQISHELLSFGQKRLFSFLCYLAVRTSQPVIADELLNGLHHEWIELCFERLYERQSFLASQHPYLLDHVPIESAEGVRKTFIRCKLERDPDGREQMVWRNFTEKEAERFFIAHQTGIQHVNEVLRTEDLW